MLAVPNGDFDVVASQLWGACSESRKYKTICVWPVHAPCESAKLHRRTLEGNLVYKYIYFTVLLKLQSIVRWGLTKTPRCIRPINSLYHAQSRVDF
jgi:hypothetical protein